MAKDSRNYREELAGKNQFWQAHIKTWEQSGIGQAAYCRSKGLALKSFWYWKKKYGGRKFPLTFVPVAVKSVSSPSMLPRTPLKLHTRSGYGIEISDGFNPETLRAVLQTLSREV